MPPSPIAPHSWPKVLLDEDVPSGARDALVALGLQVDYVRDLLGAGLADQDVLRFASTEAALLVTWNAGHFLEHARAGRAQGLHALVAMKCTHGHGARRIASIVDLIDTERRSGVGWRRPARS